MNQGNGADLLGPNDPRSTTIGMIYVAPNDDRESVLAAILTQEKLGRKQIAIVLPDQNKAFQRPVDFDGLKNMRRKLQAELVIIAPSGPGPAEFARQRHFTVFSSVDSYARSLRDASQPEVEPKRGLFGRKTKLQPADGSANNSVQMPPSPIPMPMPTPSPLVLPPPSPSPEPYMMRDEEDEPEYDNRGGAMLGGAGMGFAAGAAAGAGFAMHDTEHDDEMPTLITDDEGWDDLPQPAVFSPPPQSPAPTVVDSTAMPPQDSMAPPPVYMDEEDYKDSEDDQQAPLPLPVPMPAPEPNIIPLSPRRGRSTNQLPVAGDEDEAAGMVAPVPVSVPSNVPPRQRNGGSGSIAAVAAGAGAGAATTRRGGGGAGAGGPGTPPPQRRRRGRGIWLLALIALLLLTLLVCGGFALAAPNSPLGSAVNHVIGGGAPSATVTIIPASQTVQSKFAILAVTGKPNSSQRQVQARQLSYTTPVQSKTVKATGVGHIPATQAKGSLTFFNALSFSQTVGAGTVFTVNGVQIVNSVPAVIPGANPPTEGSVTVAAHAVTTGTSGNIGAYALSLRPCCATGISVENTVTFTGGQNEQNFTIVQQSDINNVANPLVSPTEKSALSSVQAQRHANEQFVGQPQCAPKVNANPPVGSHSQTVTVSVSATCSGEVYDQGGAVALAVTSLQNQANIHPGKSYKLVGKIVTSISKIAVIDNKGTVSLVINAAGIWEYNFGATQETQLAKLIAGKSQQAAQGILAAQTGVGKVASIVLSSGTTLPTDPTQIHIVVQDVTGLTGPPSGSGSPTTITPTVGPGTPQPGAGSNSNNGNGTT